MKTGVRPPVAPREASKSPSPLSRIPRALQAPTTRGARAALSRPAPARPHHAPSQTVPPRMMTPGPHTGGPLISAAPAPTTRAVRGVGDTRSRRERSAARLRVAAPVTGSRAGRRLPRASTPAATLLAPRRVSADVRRTMRPLPRPLGLRRPHSRLTGEAALLAGPPKVGHLRRLPLPRRPRRRRRGRAWASPLVRRRLRRLPRNQGALRQPARPAYQVPIRPRVPRRGPQPGHARTRTVARLKRRLLRAAPAPQTGLRRRRRPWTRRRASSRFPRPQRPLTSVQRACRRRRRALPRRSLRPAA